MVCDKCREREAVCEFAYGNQPAGARKWNLCEACLQEFAPGFPSQKQLEEKSGTDKPLAAGESSCGWISFSPDELRANSNRGSNKAAPPMRLRTTIFQILTLGVILGSACSSSRSGSTQTSQPLKLTIISREVRTGDAPSFEHEIFLARERFRSVADLEAGLLRLPRGTQVEYNYACLGIPGRPLAEGDDFEVFRQFCFSNHIVLLEKHAYHAQDVIRLPEKDGGK